MWKRILQTTYHCYSIIVLLDKLMRYSKTSLVCHWHDSFDPFKYEGSKVNLKFINQDNFMDRMVARKTLVILVGYLFIFWWSGHCHLTVKVAGFNPWCRNQADQGKYPGWTWNCCQVEADGMCFFYRQPIKKPWHRHPPPPSSHVAHVALSCKNDSWHNAKNKAHPLLFVKYVLVIGGLNMQEYIYVCNCAQWGERKYQMLSICEQKWFMLDSACVCGWGRGSFSYQLILHLLPTFCHPSRSFSWFC